MSASDLKGLAAREAGAPTEKPADLVRRADVVRWLEGLASNQTWLRGKGLWANPNAAEALVEAAADFERGEGV